MMRLAYVRLDKGVMTPGIAGNTITKARVRSAPAGGDGRAATPLNRDELMDEILLEGDVVLLRAKRQDVNGKSYTAERFFNRENLIDWEVLPDPPKGK